MPTNVWRGDAPEASQVVTVTPANVEISDVFSLSVNGKTVATFTATAASVSNVTAGLVAAWNESDVPEATEITADDESTHLTLTGDTAGVGFSVAASTTDASGFDLDVTVLQEGVADTNEKQQVRLPSATSGGTFTLTFSGQTTGAVAYNATAFTVRDALCDLSNVAGTDEVQSVEVTGATSGDFTLTYSGQTTAAIAYDANAAAVQSALESLSNIAVGDVVCTGGPLSTDPVVVTFRANLGRQGVAEMTATDNTDGDTAVTTTTAGVASDVTVTGSAGGPWTVEFGGAYAAINVPTMTGSGASLTGAATITVATTTQGRSTTNEVQQMVLSQVEEYPAKIEAVGDYEIQGAFYSLGELQTAYDNFYGVGNTLLTRVGVEGTSSTYRVEFTGSMAGTNQAAHVVHYSSGNTTTATTVTEGSSSGANEVQTVTVNDGPTGGTFTLTFQGQTTGAIAYDANAAAVVTALEALSNIGSGDVGVVKASNVYTVTFQGALAFTDVQQMTASAASLTGGNVYVTTTQAAAAGSNEIQRLAIDPEPGGGTFTLTVDVGGGDVTTGNLDYDASDSEVQTALEALTGIDPGDVAVSGDDGGPWTVEFQGNLAKTPLDDFTADTDSLTGAGTQTVTLSVTTPAGGPNHWNAAANWSLGTVPETGEDVVVEDGSESILYGIRQRQTFTAATTDVCTAAAHEFVDGQKVRLSTTGTLPAGLSTGTDYWLRDVGTDTFKLSASDGGGAVDITDTGSGTHTIAVELNSLVVGARYTGQIGLPNRNSNGYHEYRETDLTIGLLSSGSKSVLIGRGDGSGSGRIRLDLGSYQVTGKVKLTGGSTEANVPALLVQNSHASSAWTVTDGDVGFAFYTGETSSIATLTVNGGQVVLGDGVAITSALEVNGGEVRSIGQVTIAGTIEISG